jgi:methylated-DNA-[protein]-cysteine S-methyltransferase
MPSLSVSSPVGDLLLEEDGEALVAVHWGRGAADNGSGLLIEAARQIDAYFAGKLKDFDLPLRPAGTAFERGVWAAMQDIPYGETCSYGDLAATAHSAPRAVGRACGRNPIPIVIPCHRVLGKGWMGGYSGQGGLKTKEALLALEGALAPQPVLL